MATKIKHLPLMAAILMASVLSACSSPGAAPPTDTSDSGRRHTERPVTAPVVTRELDSAKYRTTPCELVRADQLGFPGPAEQIGDQVCKWHTSTSDFAYTVYWEQNALQNAYKILQGTSYDVFQPQTIAGQPAVVYTAFHGAHYCNATVAITHTQGIDLTISGDDQVDWCAKLVTAATDLVHNLGG